MRFVFKLKQILSCPLLLFFFSCHDRINQELNINNQNADTISKDIPRERNGQMVGYYFDKLRVEKKAGLYPLEKGFDSLQIRIWYGYAHSDTCQIFKMSKTNGRWDGEIMQLIIKRDIKKQDSILSVLKSTCSVSPRSGWDKFSTGIMDVGILSLPDMNQISGYLDVTESNTSVIVEIATQKYYRIYSYADPQFKTSIKEAKHLENILELIRDEFSFKQLKDI